MGGDQAYRSQRQAIRQQAPKARDFINRPQRHRGIVDAVERAKNRTKSSVQAKVEHPIGVVKRVFGFAKVRYRGLKKNTHHFAVTCALASLFIARRHLLRCQLTYKPKPRAHQRRLQIRPGSLALSHTGAGREIVHDPIPRQFLIQTFLRVN